MTRGRADMLIGTAILAVALVFGVGATFAPASSLAADPETRSRSVQHPAGAASMVQELSIQTAQVLASPEAQKLTQRREMLRELVHKGFDVKLTSQFVLGKYWHDASEQQRAKFTGIFTEYILNSYAHRLASFRAESLRVVSSNPVGEKDFLVETNIEGFDGPAAPVWRVRAIGGQYKIIDVTVNGVSLALTLRREFASVANRVGLEGLLSLLRQKLDDHAKIADLETPPAAHTSFLGSILASPNAKRVDHFVAGK